MMLAPIGRLKTIQRNIKKTLKEKFPGNYKIKRCQKAAIMAAMGGNDTFIRMPTGSGKSLCYQLPAAHGDGITVIVSPLLSLIHDQTYKLSKGMYQLPCATFDSRKIINNMRKGEIPDYKILFVTPEKAINNSTFLPFLRMVHQRGLLSRFVVDEAHCVSQWGASFRPNYLALGKMFREFRNDPDCAVPIMALTATNSTEDCKQAIKSLKMDKNCVKKFMFKTKMNRENLRYTVLQKDKKTFEQLVAHFLEKYPNESGIIYCLTVEECITAAKMIGQMARPYYAKMPKKQKEIFQEAWMNGKIRVLCATSAFGMGIDKSTVRFIIHHSIPRSLTEYLQESGRAGRDGNPAECVILYNFNDQFRVMKEIKESDYQPTIQNRKLRELKQVMDYCETNCAPDLIGSTGQKQELYSISPFKFKKTHKSSAYEVAKEDRRVAFEILTEIGNAVNLKLFNLRQRFPNEDCERVIRRLILSGILRISLHVNPYKKCSPRLTLSKNGHQYLEELKNFQFANLEIAEIRVGGSQSKLILDDCTKKLKENGGLSEVTEQLWKMESPNAFAIIR